MPDHLIHLPPNFRYLNQFAPSQWAPNPSKYRCVSASAAMLAEIAYPGRWIPEELEHDLYVKLAGPDVASDTNGIDKGPILDWFHSVNIGFVDMAALVEGDMEALRLEITAQNVQNVPQMLCVRDESQLRHALTGAKLHAWADQGLHHCFIRVGFSDDRGYGLYYEPAAPGFAQPVPISWHDSIVPAGIITAVALMPAGVPTPPANFSFQHGAWPVPKPVLDTAKALSTIAAMQQALTSNQDAMEAMKAAMANLANDLAQLKQEV